MKIVFLDVDGVLNHDGAHLIADECLGRLRRIAAETGAEFVLSSDWREPVLFPDRTSDYERRFTDRLMHGLGLEFAGVTPWGDYSDRGAQILEWLRSTDIDVESFVILDDLSFDFPVRFPGRFVRTSGYGKGGLTDENADQAIRILNGRPIGTEQGTA